MPDVEIYILSSDDDDDYFDNSSAIDDECLILNGDPDKPLDVANDSSYTSDELLIVAEKGQVACRDYPHPRHLCVRLPFSTNPHEKYCDLCHCYVCDSQAPCAYWGTGVSDGDHCHASDKEKIWTLQREWLKQGHKNQLPAPYNANIVIPMEHRLHNSAPASTSSHPQNCNHVPIHSNLMSARYPVSPWTFNSGLSLSSVINQRNPEQPGITVHRDRLPANTENTSPLSPWESSITNNSNQRFRNSGGSSLESPSVSLSLNSKRVRSGQDTMEKNRHQNGLNENNTLIQYKRQKSASHNDIKKASQKEKTCQSANQQKTVTKELNVLQSASQLNIFPKIPGKIRSNRKKIIRSFDTLSVSPLLDFRNVGSSKQTVKKNTLDGGLSGNNKDASPKLKTSQSASQQKGKKSQKAVVHTDKQSTHSKELNSGNADQEDDRYMELRNKKKLHHRTASFLVLRNKRKIYH